MNAKVNTQIIEENKIVSIEYTLFNNETSEVLDKNSKDTPLEFLSGKGNIVSGLDKGLLGLGLGDTTTVIVEPKDAYGEYNKDSIEEIPKEQFEGIELSEGMTLYAKDAEGKSIPALVSSIGSENIIMDYNHPLAGKTLKFEVEILDIVDATNEEIEMGAPAPKGGGCCGGPQATGCGCA